MSRSIDDDSPQDDDGVADRFDLESGELVERLPNTDVVPDSESGIPVAGRLVWVTPGGAIREISPRELEPGEQSNDEESIDADRSCPQCGTGRSVETIVREHVDCGYVGIDGFVRKERMGLLACPKCETEDETGTEFSVVATIHSCVRCGQTLDRPLGPTADGA